MKINLNDREFVLALNNVLRNRDAVDELVATSKRINEYLDEAGSLRWTGTKSQLVQIIGFLKDGGFVAGSDKKFLNVFMPEWEISNYYALRSKFKHDTLGYYKDDPEIEKIIKRLKED